MNKAVGLMKSLIIMLLKKGKEGNLSLPETFFLYLKEGIGLVGDISFTDNSSWTRSRKFRLGARVVENFVGVSVREAKTEPFIIRDHRGELYKKHHPPLLCDEVWRLEKIGKDGAFHRRLSKEKVYTVEDFLVLLSLDPARLRCILGTGMSSKMWEATVDHARTCVIDKKLHLYSPRGSEERSIVVFNAVGQLKGLLIKGQYKPVDKLSNTEKNNAHNLVVSAYKNLQEVVSIDDEALLTDGSSCPSNILHSLNPSIIENSDDNIVSSSESTIQFGHRQLSSSSSDVLASISSLVGMESMYKHGMHADLTGNSCDRPLVLSEHTNAMMFGTDSISQAFCDDEALQYFDASYSFPNSSFDSEADLHTALNNFLWSHTMDRAQRRWKMVFSVFRWFSIMRIVARKSRDHEVWRE